MQFDGTKITPPPPQHLANSHRSVVAAGTQPLASILGDFTEEVSAHTNQTLGGLIQATLGNAVEIVVAIQALYANQIRVVQVNIIIKQKTTSRETWCRIYKVKPQAARSLFFGWSALLLILGMLSVLTSVSVSFI